MTRPTMPASAREIDDDPTAYSRVTLIGDRRRADLVLPSTEPIGSLFPDILDILAETTTGNPRRLGIATATGNLLPADVSLAGAGVVDGAVLRLVAEDEIPPPPVVNDVTEETANDLQRHPGRWSPTSRRVLSVSVAAVVAGLVAVEVIIAAPAPDAWRDLIAAAGACWVLAVATRLARQPSVAVALAACGAVCGIGVGVVARAARDWTATDRLGCGLIAVWVGVGLVGLLVRRRGPAFGAALGLILTLGWLVLHGSALHPIEADGLIAVTSVVVLGLLPRWALNFSGLASLDDRRLAGDQVPRRALESSLLVAHTGLVWATVAVAANFALAGVNLADSDRPWGLGLAGAAVGVVLLRARGLPLIAEAVAVVAAGLVVAGTLELDWLDGGRRLALPVLTTAAAGALVIASMALNPPDHVRARIRGIADRAEAVAVLALVPLVLGLFGVYGRLLHTF